MKESRLINLLLLFSLTDFYEIYIYIYIYIDIYIHIYIAVNNKLNSFI